MTASQVLLAVFTAVAYCQNSYGMMGVWIALFLVTVAAQEQKGKDEGR